MLPDIKYRIYKPDEWTPSSQWEKVLQEIEAKPRRVLILEGDRGVGKTYMLLHLFGHYQHDSKVNPFFIGLDEYEAPNFSGAGNFWQFPGNKFKPEDVKNILEKLAQYLNVKDFQTLDDENRGEYLAKQLAQNQREKKLLLLVDAIYECSDEIRQKIEQNILKPLLSSKEITIVLSGRGRRPIWINPEFRDAEIIQLKSENMEFVRQQLEKMKSEHISAAEKIFNWSGGCPLVVRLLGKSPELTRDALNRAIDRLIGDSLPENLEVLKYEEIRKGIEKLALFGSAANRELEIAGYLYPGAAVSENRKKTRQLVNKLLENALLKWDEDKGGLVLNQTIAHTLQEWLKLEDGHKTLSAYRKEWDQTASNLAGQYGIEQQELLDRVLYNDIVTNVTH